MMEEFYRCKECGRLKKSNEGRVIIIKYDTPIFSGSGEIEEIIESNDTIWVCYKCLGPTEHETDQGSA